MTRQYIPGLLGFQAIWLYVRKDRRTSSCCRNMASDLLFKCFTVVFVATQCREHFVSGVVTDVRLVDGPAPSKGTVEIRQDNGTWETTCGMNLDINDVIIICRQFGFRASRALVSTPYGQNKAPSIGLLCKGDESDLSECGSLPSQSSGCLTAGAATCRGEGYLGCFKDLPTDRVLPGDSLVADPDMTISYCIQFCNNSAAANYVYAGVENERECFCGEASADYARLGEGSDANCHAPCSGDQTEGCGGSGYIAVFTINAQSSTTPAVQSTDLVETTQNLEDTSSTSGFSVTTTLGKLPSARPQSGDNIGVFAGAAGGVVFVIIIVIVIIVVIIIRKRSRRKQKDQFQSHDMAVMQPASPNGGQDNLYHDIFQDNSDETPHGSQLPAPSAEGDVTYYSSVKDQQSAEGEDTYYSSVKDQKSTFKDSNPNTAMSSNQNDGLPQKDVARRPPPNGDAGAMYAMPDKSGRKSQGEDFGALYAKPDKSGNSGQGSEDFGLLYALPDKSRGVPEGHEDASVGDTSATPDRPRLESQKDNGEGLFSLADDDTGLYAMSTAPGHTVNPDDNEYGTVMVDNELYAM